MKDQYFDNAEFRKKLKAFEDARTKGESIFMDSDELTDIAQYYQFTGNTKKAVEVTDYAISIFPGAITPLIFRSRLAFIYDRDLDKARHYISLIDDKTDLDYYYIYAEILIVDNKADEADKYLNKKLSDVNEDDLEDYYIDVATLFADYELFDKAKEWLDKSSEIKDTDYRELKAKIYMANGKYEECEQMLNSLIDENPYSNSYWNMLASSQVMHNNLSESVSSSEFSLAIDPDDEEALLTKANALFALGNYEEALNFYSKYSAIEPTDETGEMLQGVTLINLNRIEEAAVHLTKAVKSAQKDSPHLMEIYHEIAFVMSRLGKIKEALKYIDTTTKIPGVDIAEMHVLKGHIYLENSVLDKAQKEFETATDIAGDDPKIPFKIAISTYDNGYVKQAYDILKKLVKTVPDLKEGISHLALCCYRLSKNKEFESTLKKACQVNPSEAKLVLGSFFPEDMQPEDFYNYYINHKNNYK